MSAEPAPVANSAYTAAQLNAFIGDSLVVRTRDPERFRYLDVGTWACPDQVIVECLHRDTTPVESIVLGAPVAELCLTCDRQLPVPWPEDAP